MSLKCIGNQDLEQIVKFLENVFHLEKLDLGNNILRDECCSSLFQLLKHSPFLSTLVLRRNDIKAAGVAKLFEGLSEFGEVNCLDISNLEFSVQSIKSLNCFFLKRDNLKKLYMEDCKFKKDEIKIFAEGICTSKSLEILSFSRTQMNKDIFETFFESFKKNESVKTLQLGLCGIGDEGTKLLAEAIRENNSLTSVDIQANKIGDEGMLAFFKAIKGNMKMEEIKIGANQFTENSFRVLCEMISGPCALRRLDLYNIRIASFSLFLRSLSENRSIISLNISQNNCVTAEELSDCISQNSVLRSLVFSNNSLPKLGGEHFVRALTSNKSLTFLDLSGNRFAAENWQMISERVERNKFVFEYYLGIKTAMMMLQRRKDGNLVSRIPRRLLIHLLQFLQEFDT